MTTASVNFQFLQSHDLQLLRLSVLAEGYVWHQPKTCLVKLCYFGQLLTQLIAARTGNFHSTVENQTDILRQLELKGILPQKVALLFHQVRVVSDRATYEHTSDPSQALTILKIARELAIWFHRTFGGNTTFTPNPFISPPDPVDYRTELETLQHVETEFEQALATFSLHLAQLQVISSTLSPRQTDTIISLGNQAVLEIDLEENAHTYLCRGIARSDLGDNRGAINDFTQSISINSNLAQPYMERGIARTNLGDGQGAIDDFNQALDINPNLALAAYSRGVAHRDMGYLQKAIEDFNQTLHLNSAFLMLILNGDLLDMI